LHLQIYRRFPLATMVLHTHSRTQSVASRLYLERGTVRLQGWELQKALDGHTTHADVVEIPVFPNTQHMPELLAQVDAWLDSGKPLQAYLIAGHGLYTWGRDAEQARRHLDALEFLLGCEMDLRRLETP
jgi:methylthioribulose-1-phosphate dehydratase